MATDARSSNLVKSRPNTADKASSSKPRIDSSVLKKKIVEESTKSSAADAKHRSITTSSKVVSLVFTPVFPTLCIKKSSIQSKSSTKTVSKTREKKVYSLAGQKFDVPEEREPLRIFYESLSKQIPSSEMAEFWMMEHGLLSPDRAKKAYEKKQRKQKQLRMGTPIKPPQPHHVPSKPSTSKPSTSKPESSSQKVQPVPKGSDVKAKKRIANDSDEDDDDDFVLSHKRRKG